MPRYIDADTLDKALAEEAVFKIKQADRDSARAEARGLIKARDYVKSAPTVDAIPVRCGECKDSVDSKSISCAYKCTNKISPCYGRTTYADFGCLYGERKDGEK